MKPPLSVIICTLSRASSLEHCLKSLAAQTFKNFEVIIVDGGSTDKTKEVISSYTKKLSIKTVTYKEKELAKVRDQGWRKAQGRLISWIDDDVVVSPDWAKSIINTFKKDKKIAGATGPTLVPKNLLKNRDVFFLYSQAGFLKIISFIWDKFFLEGKKYEVGRILKSGAWTPGSNFPSSLKVKGLKEVDYLEACNMTLKKELVSRVGGYDYGYKAVAEWCELDLAMRVKELGYRLVFNPKIKVAHNISQGGVFSKRTKAKQRMENFFKFYFRHIFKPCSGYLFKFILYLVFLNFYWTYKAISTKNINWLGGWAGTITGLKYVKIKK
ncbi:MAG: glycosyltransferase family 2 protein [Candidatus Shapirobacteria bacterium]